MRVSVVTGLAALVLLAGCESRLNPVNWFGRAAEEPVTAVVAEAPGAPRDARPLVDRVVSLRVDRVPGGALVTAIGLPQRQGYHDAALVPEALDVDGRPAAEDGVLLFRFVALPPPAPRPVGTPASRELSAGLFLTDQTLAPVRTISVQAARNRSSARR